jgi:hypothetical protein
MGMLRAEAYLVLGLCAGCSFIVDGAGSPPPDSADSPPPDSADSPLSFSVQASADDAEENSTGAVFLDGLALDLGAARWVGVRFPGILLENGQPISGAYIQFTSSGDHLAPSTQLFIAGELTPDAPSFEPIVNNISSRLRTTEIAWDPPPWEFNLAELDQRTPDLSSIVEMIISQPGWQPSNAMVFLFTYEILENRRAAKSFDNERMIDSPKLIVFE